MHINETGKPSKKARKAHMLIQSQTVLYDKAGIIKISHLAPAGQKLN